MANSEIIVNRVCHEASTTENPDINFKGICPAFQTIGFNNCVSMGRDTVYRPLGEKAVNQKGIKDGDGKPYSTQFNDRTMCIQTIVEQSWNAVDWFRVLSVKGDDGAGADQGAFFICLKGRIPQNWYEVVWRSTIMQHGWVPEIQQFYNGKHEVYFPLHHGEKLCWIPNRPIKAPFTLEVCFASPLYQSDCNKTYIGYYQPRWYWTKPDAPGRLISDVEPPRCLETRTFNAHDDLSISDCSDTEEEVQLPSP